MLKYYRIRCATEGAYKYVWSQDTPTECPTNPAHSLDPNGLGVLECRCPRDVVTDPYVEAVLPGATSVVANDRPAIEVAAGATGWGAIQGRWPHESNSKASLKVSAKFILKESGTGTVVRIGARAKAQGVGDDSSEGWADAQYVDVTVSYDTIGEVFGAVLYLDASSFEEDDALALQVGRDGSHASDTSDVAIQIIGVKAEAF